MEYRFIGAMDRSPIGPIAVDYRQALDIARSNPGAVVTRGQNGGFVVMGKDGVVLEVGSGQGSDILQSQQENAWLDDVYRGHQAEIAGLESKIHHLQTILERERAAHAETTSALANLESRVSKVSQAEWDRIRIAEEKAREDYSKALKAERHVQTCPCLGEVENCARCDGRGTYIIDGHGNIVFE